MIHHTSVSALVERREEMCKEMKKQNKQNSTTISPFFVSAMALSMIVAPPRLYLPFEVLFAVPEALAFSLSHV
jgi:hypothetical protein